VIGLKVGKRVLEGKLFVAKEDDMKAPRRMVKGFTLLELLMVVIIIAILASIALPQYLRVSERSRASEALTVLAAIRSGEMRFKAFDPAQKYTATLTQLDVEVPGTPPGTTAMWTYTVSGTGAGSNGVATRNAGAYAGKTITLDLDNGTSCSNDATYGLTVGAC
jgi:prepilin-type N-terminal cleavage/methylation domain-containing protein